MALTYAAIDRHVRSTLGGPLPAGMSLVDIINEIGSFLCSLYPWNWLERQQAFVSLKKNRSEAELPFNFPSDLRDIISVVPSSGLTSALRPTSFDAILDLRTRGVFAGALTTWYAVVHKAATSPNLLFETETFSDGSWTGTATVTPDQQSNPFDGEDTADLLNDTDAASVQTRQQIVAHHRLKNGTIYGFSVNLKQGTASTTGIELTSSDGLLRTRATITWAGYTIALTSGLGTGVHTIKIERKPDGWVRAYVELTHNHLIGNGSLICAIAPAGFTSANTGTCHAWGAQLEAIEQDPAASGLPDGPSDYSPILSTYVPVGGAPRPVLAVAPVPTADQSNVFSFIYRAGFPALQYGDELVSIPDELNPWFLEAAIQWARGRLEEDEAYLSQRIASILVAQQPDGFPANPLLKAALMKDLELHAVVGPLEAGGYQGFSWEGRVLNPDGSTP